MGDIFLHVLFARRLRHDTGLHPIAAEAIARRAPLVGFGAALAGLPALERTRASFVKRLFGIGAAEALRWSRALDPESGKLGELALALVDPSRGAPAAPLVRLSLAIGVLSHEVLHAALRPTLSSTDASARVATERAQARLWMQFAVPNRRELVAEWAAMKPVGDADAMRRALEVTDGAMRAVLGDAPGRDALMRWARSFAHDAGPLADGSGMPDSLGVADHDARASAFDGAARFVERATEAGTRLVYLVGQLASAFEGHEPTGADLRAALFDGGGALRETPPASELEALSSKQRARIGELRHTALSRGRNPRAAFSEDVPASMPPLPEDSGEAPAFRTPAHTQELSVADIEHEGLASSSRPPPPLKTVEISAVQIEEAVSLPPTAPKVTQQISLADIAEEMVAAEEGGGRDGAQNPFSTPSSTQQVSLDDIESELAAGGLESQRGFHTPAVTQQISVADIEAEASTPPPPPDDGADDVTARENKKPPSAPTATQQISAADIEAELEAQGDSADAGEAKPPERPAE